MLTVGVFLGNNVPPSFLNIRRTFDGSRSVVKDLMNTMSNVDDALDPRGMPRMRIRFPPGGNITFLEAIKTCETLACVKEAHLIPRGPHETKYNFPHFMIAGYSKSATTTLHSYLVKHPNVLQPIKKEPAFFTDRCDYIGKKRVCPPRKEHEYIRLYLRRDRFVENDGQVLVYDATPRTFDLGPELADIMYETMPWMKMVVSMREPISRAISKYVMFKDKFGKGCFVNETLSWCLLHDKERFYGNPKKKYYSVPLRYWLDNFPVDQIKLIQFENLVGEGQAEELRGLKEFLGLDPELTGDSLDYGVVKNQTEAGNVNCRHCVIHPEGWPIEEKVYRALIRKVEVDVKELTRLIDKYKLGDAARWTRNWKAIWDRNLKSCDKITKMCHIQLV